MKLCNTTTAFVIAITVFSPSTMGFLKTPHLEDIIPKVFSIVRLLLESLKRKIF